MQLLASVDCYSINKCSKSHSWREFLLTCERIVPFLWRESEIPWESRFHKASSATMWSKLSVSGSTLSVRFFFHCWRKILSYLDYKIIKLLCGHCIEIWPFLAFDCIRYLSGPHFPPTHAIYTTRIASPIWCSYGLYFASKINSDRNIKPSRRNKAYDHHDKLGTNSSNSAL